MKQTNRVVGLFFFGCLTSLCLETYDIIEGNLKKEDL